MRFRYDSNVALAVLLVLPMLSVAQDVLPLAHHISVNVPVQSSPSSRALSAERPLAQGGAPQLEAPTGHNWQLQATLPGTIIHDMTFASPSIGYAVAEGGQVWKTTNGGKNWTEVFNLGYPYYFYGVSALSEDDIVVSGFYDSSTLYSLIRWSQDGGNTWSDDIVLPTSGWAQRVRFPNTNDGLIMDLIGDSSGNLAQYSTHGGTTPSSWTNVVDNTDGGWFGLQFSELANLHARASGINFCSSGNNGAKWSCGPSVDSVFDGPVFFLNDTDGWVGGGEISPNVEGWAHVTSNGGKTWSARTPRWPLANSPNTISKRQDRMGRWRKPLHQRWRHLLQCQRRPDLVLRPHHQRRDGRLRGATDKFRLPRMVCRLRRVTHWLHLLAGIEIVPTASRRIHKQKNGAHFPAPRSQTTLTRVTLTDQC